MRAQKPVQPRCHGINAPKALNDLHGSKISPFDNNPLTNCLDFLLLHKHFEPERDLTAGPSKTQLCSHITAGAIQKQSLQEFEIRQEKLTRGHAKVAQRVQGSAKKKQVVEQERKQVLTDRIRDLMLTRQQVFDAKRGDGCPMPEPRTLQPLPVIVPDELPLVSQLRALLGGERASKQILHSFGAAGEDALAFTHQFKDGLPAATQTPYVFAGEGGDKCDAGKRAAAHTAGQIIHYDPLSPNDDNVALLFGLPMQQHISSSKSNASLHGESLSGSSLSSCSPSDETDGSECPNMDNQSSVHRHPSVPSWSRDIQPELQMNAVQVKRLQNCIRKWEMHFDRALVKKARECFIHKLHHNAQDRHTLALQRQLLAQRQQEYGTDKLGAGEAPRPLNSPGRLNYTMPVYDCPCFAGPVHSSYLATTSSTSAVNATPGSATNGSPVRETGGKRSSPGSEQRRNGKHHQQQRQQQGQKHNTTRSLLAEDETNASDSGEGGERGEGELSSCSSSYYRDFEDGEEAEEEEAMDIKQRYTAGLRAARSR